MSIGSRITQLRMEKQWSQTQLARASGVSQPTISDYENDVVHEHRAHIVLKIAGALDTTPDFILTGSGPRSLKDAPDDLDAIIRAAQSLSSDKRAVLLATARALLLTSK